VARRLTANETACILAAAAGVIFIAVDWTGERGIDRLVDLLRDLLGASLPLRLLAFVLLTIAALGGFAVILGGFAILGNHIGAGRVLIYLGAGGGLITLVVFGWLLYTQPGVVAVHLSLIPVVIGLALCVAAQWKAKAP